MDTGNGAGSVEWASWVQAVGSIASILAAGWIARSQSVRSAKIEKQNQLAKFEALIGMLHHAQETMRIHLHMSNYDDRIARFRADVGRLILAFQNIDLFTLPSPELVKTVCSVIQELSLIKEQFSDLHASKQHGINYGNGAGAVIEGVLSTEILRCQEALSEYSR